VGQLKAIVFMLAKIILDESVIDMKLADGRSLSEI
jgi:hypothetical protein